MNHRSDLYSSLRVSVGIRTLSIEQNIRKFTALTLISLMVAGLSACDSGKPTIDPGKTREIAVSPGDPQDHSLKIAVGAMITPREGFVFYRDFLNYISEKIDMPVDYVDKESYAEINEMLKKGELDVAFVCSGPYVDGKIDFGLKPVASPQAYGESVYYSYVIVPIDSEAKSFKDLRGKTFAFTDPQSNTGTLVPTYMLALMDETPDSYFASYEYTYAHDKSIKAVAMKLVDGATVDSLIWEYENHKNPRYTSKTKIIHKSPPYGIPPVVVRPELDPEVVEKLREIFLNVHKDERGRKILAGMMIDKFKRLDDSLYDSVREMKEWLSQKASERK